MAFPRTVRTLARRIAEDIERQGHFQFPRDEYSNLFDTVMRRQGKCCVIANPTTHDLWQGNKVPTTAQAALVREFEAALSAKIGTSSIAKWSDQTPTAEVLRTLRSL